MRDLAPVRALRFHYFAAEVLVSHVHVHLVDFGRAVSVGAVYTALDRLESRGYVRSRVGDPTPQRGGRRKKYYEIEPEGAATLSRSYTTLNRMAEGLAAKLDSLAPAPDGSGD